MSSKGHSPALRFEHEAGGQKTLKKGITAVRREQNRRAQRIFREKQRAKKRFPPGTTRLQLAPRPPDIVPDTVLEYSDILGQCSNATAQDPNGPHSTAKERTYGTYCQQSPSSNRVENFQFDFSAPQTLLPDHESFVPKNGTPYSELLRIIRGHPKRALWPHGVPATLAACLFNARLLGIDIDRVMDPRYMSPFYKPLAGRILLSGSAVQPTDISTAFDPQWAHLGSLQPCFAQIMLPHHACIDLLPLSKLRETAVMLNVRARQGVDSTMPLDFDAAQEMKRDVYLREGIRFRGTDERRRDEYIEYDDSAQHYGQPWEKASWALAPWFVRKWKYLMDI